MRVISQHQKVLIEKTAITEDTQNRIHQTNSEYKETKVRVKSEKNKQRKLLEEIK